MGIVSDRAWPPTAFLSGAFVQAAEAAAMKRRIREKLLAQARAAPEDPKLAERRKMRLAAAAKKAELEAMRKKIQAQLLAHKKTGAPHGAEDATATEGGDGASGCKPDGAGGEMDAAVDE